MFIKGNMPHPVGDSLSALVPVAQIASQLPSVASSLLPMILYRLRVPVAGILAPDTLWA